MKILCMLCAILPLAVACFPPVDRSSDDMVINHGDVDIASESDARIAAGAALTVYLEHASVGGNIWAGLEDLEAGNARYDNGNILFYNRGNPGAKNKFDDFYRRVTLAADPNYRNPADYDVMMTKLCYIDNNYDGFASVTEMYTYYRDMMNSLESAYPDTVFVWWTIPIMEDGNAARDQYNTLIREYCVQNDKYLFDIADIECHDPDGNHLTNGGLETMDGSYSDDGGHLNATGRSRVASAFWALLVRIAE
ncbi:MAG TPA: SGNH/GDSL hydrolase family protein [Spirochaetia bacterium]|nr:SGNH/GDSL hydrolase family protein [Spirochaetia bacterium]